jgi:predicted acylesterase/phospholipase RssA
MYHFGVIKALWKQNLLPRVMSGSSAGSIVVGIIGTMDTGELDALFAADDEEEALRTRFSDEKLEFFGKGNPLKSNFPSSNPKPLILVWL